jgi:membrane-bound lytic murein transglycosylase F
VADSNILAINRRFYPELEIAFPLGPKQALAWIINPRLSRLQHKLKKWFPKIIADGRWDEIRERYYSHVEFFDYVDIKVFTRRIRTLLPAYRPLFEKYGRRYRLPWTLLAAKAYQESHWNPLATSPTMVRGIMMLTETTAFELGIKDRLDPEQSIRGGAAYFRKLLDRIPTGYHGHDRWNVALAAYNVGLGHIYDARRLARQRGRNPDFWLTLKEVLPLLSQERYYKRLPYGYARGIEPVLYVTRVNNYREILEKQLTITARRRQHRKPTPALAQALPAKP